MNESEKEQNERIKGKTNKESNKEDDKETLIRKLRSTEEEKKIKHGKLRRRNRKNTNQRKKNCNVEVGC